MKTVSAQALKPLLTDGEEIALVDVREHGQYGEGHPFFSVNMPYSRLELDAPLRLPRLAVRCVVFDGGDGVAERAARRLGLLGYTDVAVLEGGAPGWASAGYTLFKGVNVPSKTFGELVEHALDTPSISAEELDAMRARGEPVLLLDGRTPAEYRKMTLPGARSCPNAELAYRLPALRQDAATRVVVNCAGRTRSIIGAESLRLSGVAPDAVALRNGTQGWKLAGFDLAHGHEPDLLPQPDARSRAAAREAGARLLASAGVPVIDEAAVTAWRASGERTVHLFDVRTAEEFACGHAAGAEHAPGGQLVQATDQWVAVRNAKLVLHDDALLRAATTAVWLRGMGHDVSVLDGAATREAGAPAAVRAPPGPTPLGAGDLAGRLAAGALLLDLSPGMRHRAAHIEDARWATRARLDQHAPQHANGVVLTGPAEMAALAALDLDEAGCARVEYLRGGPDAWREAGLSVVSSPQAPADEECIDYLFFVHDRHDGNLDAARRYLQWETGLVDQLDAQERGVLMPPPAAAP